MGFGVQSCQADAAALPHSLATDRSMHPVPEPTAHVHGPPGLVRSPIDARPAVLLSVAQAVAAHADLGALLRDLAVALGGHLPLGYLSFALLDPEARSARLQFLEPIGGVPAP